MPEQQRPDGHETSAKESPARKPLEPAPQLESPAHAGASERPQRRTVITPGMTRQLQRAAGNRAVVTLLRHTDQDAGPRSDEREHDTGPDVRAGEPGPGGTRGVAAAPPPGPPGDGPAGTRTVGAEAGSDGRGAADPAPLRGGGPTGPTSDARAGAASARIGATGTATAARPADAPAAGPVTAVPAAEQADGEPAGTT